MASSRSRTETPPPQPISSVQNGSPIKSSNDSVLSSEEAARSGASGSGNMVGQSALSKGKEKQKRLSQVVPKRPKGQELVNEDAPWDAKNVLSFDGGGIRGLYSLFILRQLMNKIQFIEESFSDGKGEISHALSSFTPCDEPQHVSHILRNSQDDNSEDRAPSGHFLPCHYFDYICGTSTGGLIAIMLSRLRMTVDDCIIEYENLAGKVFGNPRLFHQTFTPTMWLKRPKYDATNLEAIIGDVVRRRGEICLETDSVPFISGKGMCRTCVFAYRKEGQDNQNTGPSFDIPYIFRSYDHFQRGTNGTLFSLPRNAGKASTFPIWKVARATTAAPLYFAPMRVVVDGDAPQPKGSLLQKVKSFGRETVVEAERKHPVTFIDGGFGEANNPSEEAFHEVETSNEKIGTFVSIGTGRGKVDKFQTGLRRLVQASFAAVGDPEPAHLSMLRESQNPDHGFGYFRLNEPNGLPDLDFDEWKPKRNGNKTRKKILDAFQRWAIDPKVSASISHCALELVRRRRLRTADESQWERFALEVFFDCKEDKCPQPSDKRWYNRNDFQIHLMEDHKMEEERELQAALRSHRRAWRYKPPPNGG